jgi:hypothetical protein
LTCFRINRGSKRFSFLVQAGVVISKAIVTFIKNTIGKLAIFYNPPRFYCCGMIAYTCAKVHGHVSFNKVF